MTDCRILALIFACLVVSTTGEAVADPARQPAKQSTTLNIDGVKDSVYMFGREYAGMRVTHVGANGLAAVAGVRVGDVLLSLNARAVASAEEADAVLNDIPSGNLEVVVARRKGEVYKLVETRIEYTNPYREQALSGQLERDRPPQKIDVLEARMIELINTDRREAGARPIAWDKTLSRIARAHADDMVKRKYFSHVSPDGQTSFDRAAAVGVGMPFAENIAAGMLSPEEAQTTFMSEPADDPSNHRGNIVNPAWRYAGVGMARTKAGTLVIVQTFSNSVPDSDGR